MKVPQDSERGFVTAKKVLTLIFLVSEKNLDKSYEQNNKMK